MFLIFLNDLPIISSCGTNGIKKNSVLVVVASVVEVVGAENKIVDMILVKLKSCIFSLVVLVQI